MSFFSLPIAFFAGFVSFLSPCILPILPGFLAYLAGTSLEGKESSRTKVFFHSMAFVLGFSLIFALLGVLLATVLAHSAFSVQVWLARAGGVAIIFFGLYLTGLIEIKYFDRPHAFVVRNRETARYATSFLFGVAFAAGWTPCVGPALGAILGLATSTPTLAFSLLLAYALGLGIPFLLLGLFTGEASRLITKYERIGKYVNVCFGVLLIGLGVLVFTGRLSQIASFEFINTLLLK